MGDSDWEFNWGYQYLFDTLKATENIGLAVRSSDPPRAEKVDGQSKRQSQALKSFQVFHKEAAWN